MGRKKAGRASKRKPSHLSSITVSELFVSIRFEQRWPEKDRKATKFVESSLHGLETS